MSELDDKEESDVDSNFWGVEEDNKDIPDVWENIRLQQPNKTLPRSFLERYKLLFLSWFDNLPRLQNVLRRIQFINILIALGGFYLIICFIFPTLIQLGYASACHDNGMEYVMWYHKCMDPIELQFGLVKHNHMSKYDVLWRTISLDYGRELDGDVDYNNLLRDQEQVRINNAKGNDSKFFPSFGNWDAILNNNNEVSEV